MTKQEKPWKTLPEAKGSTILSEYQKPSVDNDTSLRTKISWLHSGHAGLEMTEFSERRAAIVGTVQKGYGLTPEEAELVVSDYELENLRSQEEIDGSH
jgi:hypothetical protein